MPEENAEKNNGKVVKKSQELSVQTHPKGDPKVVQRLRVPEAEDK